MASELKSAPSALGLYPQVIAGAARAALPGGSSSGPLPSDELVLPDVEVDRAHLEAYARMCTFPIGDELPLTYPHLLGFGMSLKLMSRGDFPFPALGLVHVSNRIERRRVIRADERLRVSVRAADLPDHPRGHQFDMRCVVSAGGEEVWSESSTYLRREGGSGGGGSKRSGSGEETPKPQATFSVPGDIGRRYGAVSGDRNPIHLHPLSAKAFGMPRAIAHGMWLKARVLAILDDHVPAAAVASVDFKLPVLLPARVALASWAEAEAEGTGRAFAVTDARSEKPHLRGSVVPLA